ncbi:MAG: GNAT family N-acetyltransferase [Deltaproteobacteria bacterium]|nr:GNAT family N-acetyltransferase [Deltaproteobacteria bacterium]MDP2971535.1 GNAT family N-acetyltransferase [Deltaproteobacteria bacterium]
MNIREALPADNDELQKLQAKCPQGRTIIVSIVNTPDFFARAKAYRSYKIFVAFEDDRIIGSAACAIRDGTLNGNLNRIGYEFQYFTSPDCRGRGVAKQLHKQIEDYLSKQEVILSYLLVMEGNSPAKRLFEGLGFHLHRHLMMTGVPIFKKMEVTFRGNIRPMAWEDLEVLAGLLNQTWQGYDFYEPTSAQGLREFISRTPGLGLENLLVLEKEREVLACLGFCDWSQMMRITLEAISLKMRLFGMLLDALRLFRPMPKGPKPGDMLKQWMLTPIAFRDPEYVEPLLRYLNNQALVKGIAQIFSVFEQGDVLLSRMKGFIRLSTGMSLYVKPLQLNASVGNRSVFVDGIDL